MTMLLLSLSSIHTPSTFAFRLFSLFFYSSFDFVFLNAVCDKYGLIPMCKCKNLLLGSLYVLY